MNADTFYKEKYQGCCHAHETLTSLRKWLINHALESQQILDTIVQAEEMLDEFATILDIIIEEECTLTEAMHDSDIDFDHVYDEGMHIIDGMSVDDELETVFYAKEAIDGADAAQKHYDGLKTEFEDQFRAPVVAVISEGLDFFVNIPRN